MISDIVVDSVRPRGEPDSPARIWAIPSGRIVVLRTEPRPIEVLDPGGLPSLSRPRVAAVAKRFGRRWRVASVGAAAEYYTACRLKRRDL